MMRRMTCVWSTTTMTVRGCLTAAVPVTDPIGRRRPNEELRSLCGFDTSKIRNFCIIAHVDHGKTTLADAIMRRVGLLEGEEVGTYLDKLEVEKQRGITVKAQACTLLVEHPVTKQEYMLNLVDTPGHVDFQSEVGRSLSVCDGAVLLVDATQGVQAQTLANFQLAMQANVNIVPALSKLDAVRDEASLQRVIDSLENATGLIKREMILTCARSLLGVEALLVQLIDSVSPPTVESGEGMKAHLVDCYAVETTNGVESWGIVKIVRGSISAKRRVWLVHGSRPVDVVEVGILYPNMVPIQALSAGMIGYVKFGSNESNVIVGETLASDTEMQPLPILPRPKPTIFGAFFPHEGDMIYELQRSVTALRQSDPLVTSQPVRCPALGEGLQLGFVGMLHLQVFKDRLFSEFGRRVLVTPPVAEYRYVDREGGEHALDVYRFVWRHEGAVRYLEPVVRATMIAPIDTFPHIEKTATTEFRAVRLECTGIDDGRVLVRYRVPLAELTRGLYEAVKKLSHGFATLEYDTVEFEEADLVKLDIVINKAHVGVFSTVILRESAQRQGRRLVEALKEHLPRSIVDIPIQAMVGNKIVARETVKAYSKDVCAKIHAGDPTRKAKKLNDQKKGKERLAHRLVGTVRLDQDTISAVLGAT